MRALALAAATTGLGALALASAASGGMPAQGRTIRIQEDALPAGLRMDDRFQSYQLGMSHLTGGDTWRSYDALPKDAKPRPGGDLSAVREAREATDLASPRLRTLVAALGPFYIRYGGTTSNAVYFQDDDNPKLAQAPDGYKTVLTRARWKEAVEFAKAVDAKIVTGFSVGPGVRDADGNWTPRHAAPWVEYTHSIGGEIYAAEMYNEPNLASHDQLVKDYTPARFARDFAQFRRFAAEKAPRMKVVGPGDVQTGPTKMPGFPTGDQFFTASPAPKFDIVSYHYYPALAERCAPAGSPMGITPDQALSEEWLARQDGPLAERKALRDRFAPGATIWNTETGAASCGGPKWQPTFRDVFRYLDSNARLAKQGLGAMFTHALISGSNGVIDEKTFLPNPNYWGALLWRRFMGTQILDAGPIQPGLHVYAHCQRGMPGGVTLLAINLEPTSASVEVRGRASIYAMTAKDLDSSTLLLNGKPLVLGVDDTLPAISPVRLQGTRVKLAPSSVNFITLPSARNPSCSS